MHNFVHFFNAIVMLICFMICKMTENSIGIAVADDSPIHRKLISIILKRDPRFHLHGVFNNGSDLILAIDQMDLKPSVYFLDILMPIKNGPQTSILLKELNPNALIFGYTSLFCSPMVDQMYYNGAKKIYQKGEKSLQLIFDEIYECCILELAE